MGTILAVHKNDEICLASDCINLYDKWATTAEVENPTCFITIGKSILAISSSLALQQALSAEIKKITPQNIPALTTIDEVRVFFTQAHAILRNNYFMQVNFQNKQDFEWTPMRAIVVNSSGLYRVESDRGVYKHLRYAAIGSGDAFAIGSLEALYPLELKAEQIARQSLEAASKLDSGGGKERIFERIKITELTVSRSRQNKTAVIKPIKKFKRTL